MTLRPTILGVPVDAINMQNAIAVVAGWLERKELHYICVTPAHSIMDCREDPELLSIFKRSGLSTPDGMSVVWLLKLMGYKDVSRVYGPDLLLALCEYGLPLGWKHYFYGGSPNVIEALIKILTLAYPSLKIAGHYSPPYRPLNPEEDAEIINNINNTDPDIIWAGLGAPKQERWMDAHRSKLQAPVIVGVGAAFDFLSGHKSQAPKWIQHIGMEWLYRLLSEPTRLWPRYRRYPHFAFLALAQLFGFSSSSSSRKEVK